MRRTTKGELLEKCANSDVSYFARFEGDIVGRFGPADSTDDDGHYLESRAIAKLDGRVFRGVTIDIVNGTPKGEVLQLIDKLRAFIERTEETYFDFPVIDIEPIRETELEIPF